MGYYWLVRCLFASTSSCPASVEGFDGNWLGRLCASYARNERDGQRDNESMTDTFDTGRSFGSIAGVQCLNEGVLFCPPSKAAVGQQVEVVRNISLTIQRNGMIPRVMW